MRLTDLEVLKEIPGYRAILRAVLKSQIQMLVEQLAEQTEEESVILTASVTDGSLSHLGSTSGKDFMSGREEMKSQFLQHCLQRHHSSQAIDSAPQIDIKNPYVPTDNANNLKSEKSPGRFPTSKLNARQRNQPYMLGHRHKKGNQIPQTGTAILPENTTSSTGSDGIQSTLYDSPSFIVKSEAHGNSGSGEDGSEDVGFGSSLRYSQGSIDEHSSQTVSETQSGNESARFDGTGSILEETINLEDSQSGSMMVVKEEPADETDEDMSITGVEPGTSNSFPEMTYSDWSPASGEGSSQGDEARLLGRSSMINNADHNLAYTSEARPPKTKITKIPCHLCSKLISAANMRKHLVIHSGVRKYKCEQCGKAFSQGPGLKRHLICVHNIMPEQQGWNM